MIDPVMPAQPVFSGVGVETRASNIEMRSSAPMLVHRIARFGFVGVTCFFVQLGLLNVLQSVWHIYVADVIAFLISAQVNFALSRWLTWGDRRHAQRLGWQWIKFNASAFVSATLFNAGVLWALVHLGLRIWLAMLLANLVTACCTFTLNHFVVFRTRARTSIYTHGEVMR